jgi:hypothetical protein
MREAVREATKDAMQDALKFDPILSSVCASCDGPMERTKDAIGRERYRCPKCQGVAKARPRHPDDAMIPQGLVPVAGTPPRVLREIVRVIVPAPAPPAERVVELPPIRKGQLRCQLCGEGVDPAVRFCSDCSEGGYLILKATRLRAQAAKNAAGAAGTVRRFDDKPCAFRAGEASTDLCGELFTPSGPRSAYCERHRTEVDRARWRADKIAQRADRRSRGELRENPRPGREEDPQ